MRCQTQRQCYQRGWKMKLQQEVGSLAIWMSWFPWILDIAAMLGVKSSHFGVLRILMPVFTVPSAFKLVSDREQYPMLPTSVYGNKIVVGYEDAMRTITQEMVVMSVQSN
jgi:hypothetical protein